MNVFQRYVLTAVFGLLPTTIVLGQGAEASPQSSSRAAATSDSMDAADREFHVNVAPYLWFAGIDGTVGALGHETSVHVSARDVLSNFNFGLMGAVEMRYNRIVIPVDIMWVRLKDSKGIPISDEVESVNTKINEVIFTPKVGYRIVDKSRFKADALMGLRYWHLGTTLTLQPTQISNGFYGTASWVDGVEGAKFQAFLTEKAILTIAGDAGGGGSKLDYQVVGLFGYKLKRVTLQGGWRYLVIHQKHSGQAFADLAMTGVVVGAVIPLK
jgi:hypothetical protein